MANIYGPALYRPNPSGLTLTSTPRTWSAPPAPTPAPFNPLPIEAWAMQNGLRPDPIRPFNPHSQVSGGTLSYGEGGVTAVPQPPRQYMGGSKAIERGYADYLESGGMSLGSNYGGGMSLGRRRSSSVPGPISLDSNAASYANFLNGMG